MKPLLPILEITLALVFGPSEFTYLDSLEVPQQIGVMEVSAGILLFEHVGVGGTTYIHTEPPWIAGEGWTFGPFRADFDFWAYLEFGPLQAGFRHRCIHPVKTMGSYYGSPFGGSDMIYLSYKPDFRKGPW